MALKNIFNDGYKGYVFTPAVELQKYSARIMELGEKFPEPTEKLYFELKDILQEMDAVDLSLFDSLLPTASEKQKREVEKYLNDVRKGKHLSYLCKITNLTKEDFGNAEEFAEELKVAFAYIGGVCDDFYTFRSMIRDMCERLERKYINNHRS